MCVAVCIFVVAASVCAVDLAVPRVVAEGARIVACAYRGDDLVRCRVDDGHVVAATVRAVDSVVVGTAAEGRSIRAGRDPGNLPIEVPDFYLTINVGVAEAIGIEIPEPALRQANTVVYDEGNEE